MTLFAPVAIAGANDDNRNPIARTLLLDQTLGLATRKRLARAAGLEAG